MKKFRKVFCTAILTMIFAISVLAAPTNATSLTYKDVPVNHWAYKTIQEATTLGFLKGNGDGTFAPDKDVSRAELATLLSRFFNVENRQKVTFNDIDSNFWAISAIEELITLNIIVPGEYSNNKFEPNKAMTRAEMAKWFTRALAVKQGEYTALEQLIRTSQHTLIPITEFYRGGLNKADYGHIGIVLGTGLYTGYEDGSFRPNALTKRSEVATLAIRLKDLLGQEPSKFSGLNEILEVSKTGTNMLSISPFEYLTENTFNTVANKWTDYGTIGQMQLHHAIFIPFSNYAASQKSIYGKMFVDSNTRFFENTYEIFIHKTFKANQTKNINLLSFIGSSNNVFFATPSPQYEVAKDYGYAYLTSENLNLVQNKTFTYWASFIQRMGAKETNGTTIKNGESEFLYRMK